MGDEEHGLLGVVDLVLGEKGLIVLDEGYAIAAGNVARPDDDELVPGDGRIASAGTGAPSQTMHAAMCWPRAASAAPSTRTSATPGISRSTASISSG